MYNPTHQIFYLVLINCYLTYLYMYVYDQSDLSQMYLVLAVTKIQLIHAAFVLIWFAHCIFSNLFKFTKVSFNRGFFLPSPCLTLSRMIWFTHCCSNPTCPGRPGPLRWCLIWWGRWPSTWGGSWRRWWGRWCGYTCRCRWLACRRFVPAVGSARVGQVGEAPAGLALKCRGIISIVLQRQCAPKMQHENRIVLKRQWQI